MNYEIADIDILLRSVEGRNAAARNTMFAWMIVVLVLFIALVGIFEYINYRNVRDARNMFSEFRQNQGDQREPLTINYPQIYQLPSTVSYWGDQREPQYQPANQNYLPYAAQYRGDQREPRYYSVPRIEEMH